MAKIIRREMPDLGNMAEQVTIRVRHLEDGQYQATSPNHPELNPVTGSSQQAAVNSFKRRVHNWVAAGFDAEMANERDPNLSERVPYRR